MLMELLDSERGRRIWGALVIGIFCAAGPLFGQGISAYVDANGKVVFNNDPTPVRAPVFGTDKGRAEGRSSQPSERQAHIASLIEQTAAFHSVDPELVRAVVEVESNFNPLAVSPKGAMGLMQLIPGTARRFGVSNVFDPAENLDGGVRYLKYLIGMFDGNLELSLAAYNAGENAVLRSRGVPAIRETRDYLRKINGIYPLQRVASVPNRRLIVRTTSSDGVVRFTNIGQ